MRLNIPKRLLILLFLIYAFCAHAADSNVRLNSIGFLPNNVKGVTSSMSGTTFTVVRVSDSAVMFTGNLGGAVAAADSGETVYKGDFSAFTTPGTYRVNVAGVGNSVNFVIADDVYNATYVTSMRAMYLWRCNTAVSGTYGADTFSHAACHMNDAYLDYVGGGHVIRDGKGGWHDAGDYNKYIVNAGITVGMMFMAWEHFSAKINTLALGIPNTAPAYPDYLKEMKYEIDWVLKMAYADGTGRVSAKLSALAFDAFEMPEAETAARFFTDWGSAATADYVAMLAMAARIFYPYDPAYSQTCITAATTAFNYLLANTANKNPDYTAFSTGGYGTTDGDDRLWAAAEMWATTGSTTAHQDFTTRANAYTDKIDADFDWGTVKNLGMYTYLMCTRTGKVTAVRDAIQADMITHANALVGYRNSHGYARMLCTTTGTPNYYWGCNGSVARQAMLLQIANMVSPSANYVNSALDILGYIFGRNMHRRSYVTGVGTNPPMFPHDRRSGADGIANPWPGYLVGGSNGSNTGDPILTAMAGGQPAAVYWQDVEGSYASNEIAINWQGALIYALAGFIGIPSGSTPTFTPTITRTWTLSMTATPTFTRTRTATSTSTISPTFTRTVSASATASVSPSYTNTRTPTASVTTSGTFTRTGTPVITFTFTATRTNTPSPSASFTGTPTGTYTRTGTPSNTSTFTRTASASASASATASVSPTFSYTRTPSSTYTRTRTMTPTYSATVSSTFTATRTSTPTNTCACTGTNTRTPSSSATSSASATFTYTGTRTASATATGSMTGTYTASVTPTNSMTRTNTPTGTATRTNTPSSTATYTRTVTSTYTSTGTSTATRTITSTWTIVFYSPTFTPTGTLTYTRTVTVTRSATPTRTPSLTGTASGTVSATATLTETATATGSPSASRTFTATGTHTQTASPSFTQTVTLTFTITRTASPTSTCTRTATGTYTVTQTNSVSPTITGTWTGTPPTLTFTPTITVTSTRSQTPSPSATASSVPSDTITPTSTETPADTATVTPTRTPTSTRTRTATPTYSLTLTITLTGTFTVTRTNTPVNTATLTFTRTATSLNTATNTPVNTATNTSVPTMTITITYTPVPSATLTPVNTPTPDIFEINNVVTYPNPYHPGTGAGAYLGCDITQDAALITIKIYTSGFRAVKVITIPGTITAGRVDRHIEERDLGKLAGGVYYYVVTAVSTGKIKAKAPPGLLVIIR